jgi:hypothetical protein
MSEDFIENEFYHAIDHKDYNATDSIIEKIKSREIEEPLTDCASVICSPYTDTILYDILHVIKFILNFGLLYLEKEEYTTLYKLQDIFLDCNDERYAQLCVCLANLLKENDSTHSCAFSSEKNIPDLLSLIEKEFDVEDNMHVRFKSIQECILNGSTNNDMNDGSLVHFEQYPLTLISSKITTHKDEIRKLDALIVILLIIMQHSAKVNTIKDYYILINFLDSYCLFKFTNKLQEKLFHQNSHLF